MTDEKVMHVFASTDDLRVDRRVATEVEGVRDVAG